MDPNLTFTPHIPHSSLLPYIEYYWIGKSKVSLFEQREVSVFPINMHTLILVDGDSPLIFQNNSIKPIPNVCLIGILSHMCKYYLVGSVSFVAIRFKPSGFFRFFGIPANHFVDNCIDFELCCKESNYVLEKIATVKSDQQIVECLNKFFIHQGSLRNYLDQKLIPVKGLVNYFRDNVSMSRFSEFCKDHNQSTRSMRQALIEKVGIPPKLFSRIERFNHAYNALIYQKKKDLHDIIYRMGYFDQAHFLKEFRHFTNQTPGSFIPDFPEFDLLHRG